MREGGAKAQRRGGGAARDPERNPSCPSEPLVTAVRRMIGELWHA
jgi:hypothetical protein